MQILVKPRNTARTLLGNLVCYRMIPEMYSNTLKVHYYLLKILKPQMMTKFIICFWGILRNDVN